MAFSSFEHRYVVRCDVRCIGRNSMIFLRPRQAPAFGKATSYDFFKVCGCESYHRVAFVEQLANNSIIGVTNISERRRQGKLKIVTA
eukprot:IDg21250t1